MKLEEQAGPCVHEEFCIPGEGVPLLPFTLKPLSVAPVRCLTVWIIFQHLVLAGVLLSPTHNGFLSLPGWLPAVVALFLLPQLTRTQLERTRVDPRYQIVLSWVSFAIFRLGYIPMLSFQVLIRAILLGFLVSLLALAIHPSVQSFNKPLANIYYDIDAG